MTLNTISISVPNLNDSGYGVGGLLTRKEWQVECIKKVLSGADIFNKWQIELNQSISSERSPPPNFDVDISYSDNSTQGYRLGWSDTPSNFVVDLTNYTFDQNMSFSRYVFLTGVIFNGCTFSQLCTFDNAVFERDAYFIGAIINNAVFTNSILKKGAIFDGAVFTGIAVFTYSEFMGVASFKNTKFLCEANFEGAKFNYLSFIRSFFEKDVDFSGNSYYNDNDRQKFGYITFAGTTFKGRADFSNREFNARTDFGADNGKFTEFEKVPLFHNCELHQDTTFESAIFPKSLSKDETDVRAYNTLRFAMNKQQFVLAERRFSIYELDAERELSNNLERIFYYLYKTVSDYGFSISRPFITLIFLPIMIFGIVYGLIESFNNCGIAIFSSNCSLDLELIEKTIKFTLIQSLPPIGLDKINEALRESLFKNGPSIGLLIIMVIQKILSLIGWFLIGLGFRNLFKIK